MIKNGVAMLTLALIAGLHNVSRREMLLDAPKGHALT